MNGMSIYALTAERQIDLMLTIEHFYDTQIVGQSATYSTNLAKLPPSLEYDVVGCVGTLHLDISGITLRFIPGKYLYSQNAIVKTRR